MKVDRSRAVRKEVAGETFYFCSDDCWHAFEADPERYVHARGLGHDPQHLHAH